MIQHAIVRDPGPDAATGLTTQSGAPLCFKQLQHQHAAYCDALAALGVELIRLAFSLNDLNVNPIRPYGIRHP